MANSFTPTKGTAKKSGQNTAEYVILIGVILGAFAGLNAYTGGTVSETLSNGISDHLMILLTLLRLPF